MAASLNSLRRICPLQHIVQQHLPQLLRLNGNGLTYVPAMTIVAKHKNPQFTKYRRLKVHKDQLDAYMKMKADEKLTEDELRMRAKKKGEAHPYTFDEAPIDIETTAEVIEPYEPPEGDGKSSLLSKVSPAKVKKGAQDRAKRLRDGRILKKWEDNYNKKAIAFELQDVYLEAQKRLQDIKKNKDELFDYVTERAYHEMTYGLDNKTIRWEFVETVVPPKLVQHKVQAILNKDNYFAQLTVRMHTKQKLAIYDRFGRLMYGSEHLIKDVLEYVVFEKHIVNEYGRWRVHGKIIPDTKAPREPIITTFRKPKEKEEVQQ